MQLKRNIGFDGRRFLLESEWLTYCRRKPVRYIRKLKTHMCQICGLPASLENPLQNAHIIGFDIGVIDLALTPEFLDSDMNIVTAHRKICNKKSELSLSNAIIHLKSFGVNSLPKFLISQDE